MVKFTDILRKRAVPELGYYSGDVATSGDNTLVAGVSGSKIRVIRYALSASNAVNAYFKSASTRISGTKYMAQSSGWSGGEAANCGHFETVAGDGLVLNLSGNVSVGVDIVYSIEPTS